MSLIGRGWLVGVGVWDLRSHSAAQFIVRRIDNIVPVTLTDVEG
jgi:hypothetical protein